MPYRPFIGSGAPCQAHPSKKVPQNLKNLKHHDLGIPANALASPVPPNSTCAMAHSLRRPLSSILGISSSTSQRCFSQYQPLRGVDRQAQAMAIKPHSSPDKSLRVASQGAANIPSDLGLLACTSALSLGLLRALLTYKIPTSRPRAKTSPPHSHPPTTFCTSNGIKSGTKRAIYSPSSF